MIRPWLVLARLAISRVLAPLKPFWVNAFTAALTLIIGAAYTLWMVKRVFYGEVANENVAALKDLESYAGNYYSSELEINFKLDLDKNQKLLVSLPKRSKKYEVEIINRNELLIWDYILKIERDDSKTATPT